MQRLFWARPYIWSTLPLRLRMESRSVRPRLETFVPIGSLNGFLQVGIQVALEFAAVREVPEFIAWARETFGTPFVLAALGETISSGTPSPCRSAIQLSKVLGLAPRVERSIRACRRRIPRRNA